MDEYSLSFAPDSSPRRAPGSVEFGLVGAALVALVWSVVVPRLKLSRPWRVASTPPAVIGLIVVGLGADQLATGIPVADPVVEFAMLLIDGAVLSTAALLVGVRPTTDGRVRALTRTLCALAAVGSLGWVHSGLTFSLMTAFSEADWDTPPGTGYVSAAFITAAAVGVLVVTFRPTRRVVGADVVEQEQLIPSR